ncbi:MAG TPA: Rab family GTPase [Chitinophagales bacterium]|nr:Rab family GTPase [Chitinophagales bacterium]HRK26959.1 Rab family GTPase [Chitinophagales bacterium]
MRTITKKVILTGSFAVGKTSLISRFVYQKFSATYKTTLGVRIDRKTVELPEITINMLIWDIGGEQTQLRVPETYYLGSSGVIYVYDISRPSSFSQIHDDLAYLKSKLHDIPLVIVGNKTDLLDPVTLEEAKQLVPVNTHFFTSAKDGTNVESLFIYLAKQLVNDPSGI